MTRRLWDKTTENEDGCWIWKGTKLKTGYGAIYYEGRRWRVHRLAYDLTYEDLFDEEVVMHLCNNKLCCNPEHLRAGTQSENLKQAGMEGKMTREEGPGVKSSLSEDELEYIKTSNLSNRALARKYGLKCHKTISAIRRGHYKDPRRM